MTVENVKELVSAAMSEGETTPVESTPTPVVENVSSQEVKTEATPVIEAQVVETKPVVDERNDSQKDAREEQINNLNKALSIEREERKKLEAELGTVKPVFDKFKSAFAPDPEPVINEPVVEDEQSKFEQWYAQKEAAKQEEQNQTKLQEMIKTQIDTLSKEWNGEGGKPKYDDNEVYRWQRDNGKEYLTPEEAFTIMKRNDIIDWQARQVTSKVVPDISSERPAGTSTDHSPSKTTPRTDQEIKNAVMEALSNIG